MIVVTNFTDCKWIFSPGPIRLVRKRESGVFRIWGKIAHGVSFKPSNAALQRVFFVWNGISKKKQKSIARAYSANKWLSSRVWCRNNSHKVEQVLFTRLIRLVFCFKVAGALRRKQCYPLQCQKEATERIPRGIPWGASSLLYWWKEWPLQ